MANVFFLADSLPLGGVTSYIKTICGALHQRGHQVTVIINEEVSRPEDEWPVGVGLQTLAASVLDTRALLTSRLRKLLLDAGAEWVFYNNCYYVDSYAVRDTRINAVYVVHNNQAEEAARFMKEGLYCQHLVAPTPAVTARFQNAFPEYHTLHIAHGTHVPQERLQKTGPFHIVYLGRLSPEKGVDLLAPIVAPLLNKYADMRFILLGSGKEGYDYEKSIHLALRDAVRNQGQLHMPGALKGPALNTALQSADVLLLPSREEAFGLAAIEGAAWGAVPIVTSISGVTDQIFDHGTEAFLCKQGDVSGFAEAVECLYTDADLRERMAEAAYQKVKARFSVEAMAAQYETLLATPAKPLHTTLNSTQRAFAAYRHLLLLKARKALV